MILWFILHELHETLARSEHNDFFHAFKTIFNGQVSVICDHYFRGFLVDDRVLSRYDEKKAVSADRSSRFHFPYST